MRKPWMLKVLMSQPKRLVLTNPPMIAPAIPSPMVRRIPIGSPRSGCLPINFATTPASKPNSAHARMLKIIRALQSEPRCSAPVAAKPQLHRPTPAEIKREGWLRTELLAGFSSSALGSRDYLHLLHLVSTLVRDDFNVRPRF